jgi:hypothetical protein
MKYIIDEIKKLEIKDIKNDVIVITFDVNETDLYSANMLFEELKSALPNHNLLGLMKNYDLSVKQIDELMEYLQDLKEKAKNDNIH